MTTTHIKPFNFNLCLVSPPFNRPFGRRRLGFIAGFHTGDSESISHGWSERYVFTLVFLAGNSQGLVFLPTYVGAQWTISTFPTSLLSSAFPQHTGI